MDNVSRKSRSRIMSAIRSKNNKTTEIRMKAVLVRSGIKGWKIRATKLPGNPDFTFTKRKLAVFIDGCFWHGCPTCYRRPSSSRKYWDQKKMDNKRRDKQVVRLLHLSNWEVIRIWEHTLKKNPTKVINRIADLLGKV